MLRADSCRSVENENRSRLSAEQERRGETDFLSKEPKRGRPTADIRWTTNEETIERLIGADIRR